MGVVNVTPDSFSDGGRFLDPDAAVAHGLALVAAGADCSTSAASRPGPGADPVDADEELRRVAAGRRAPGRRRRRAGQHRHDEGRGRRGRARGRRDDRERRLGRRRRSRACSASSPTRGAGFVAMHMQGEPRTMQDDPRYDDVVAEVGDVPRRAASTRRGRGRHRARRDAASTPASASARRSSTTSRCSRALAELVARVERAGARRRRRGSRSSARVARRGGVPRADARDDGDAGDDGAGRSTTAPRSCACTTSQPPCTRVRAARRARARDAERTDGGMSDRMDCGAAGRRDSSRAYFTLGHQGPARRASSGPGGFARNHRKVRRQEELIWLVGPRVHARPLAARLAAQPARVRGGGHRVRARAARPPRRAGRAAARASTRRSASWLDDPDEKRAHPPRGVRRPAARRARRLPPLRRVSSTEGPHAIVVDREAHRPQLGAVGREIVAVTVDEKIVAASDRERRAADRMGTHPHRRPARARRARRARPRSRRRPQPFEVDVELDGRPRPRRARATTLDDTVDYAAVCEAVSRVVASERYQLLERLATRIAEVCRADDRACTASSVDGAQAAPAGAGDGRPRRRCASSGDAARVPRARVEPRRPARAPPARGRRTRRDAGRRVSSRCRAVYETDARRRAGAGRLPERGRRDRHRARPVGAARASRSARGARASGCARERGGPARSTSTSCSSATSQRRRPGSRRSRTRACGSAGFVLAPLRDVAPDLVDAGQIGGRTSECSSVALEFPPDP